MRSTDGDVLLGGEDIDALLVGHFVGVFKEKHQIDLYDTKDDKKRSKALKKLTTACSQLKVDLSRMLSSDFCVDELSDDIAFEASLDRYVCICLYVFVRAPLRVHACPQKLPFPRCMHAVARSCPTPFCLSPSSPFLLYICMYVCTFVPSRPLSVIVTLSCLETISFLLVIQLSFGRQN